jgi:hypothetical protein
MNKMATTGISLLPSREQGIACSARRCPRPDALPSRLRGSGWHVGVSAARGQATRQPTFGVVTGHKPRHARMRQALPSSW